MQPVRGVGAAAATFGLFLLSCQHAEVVASRSTASAFIPAPQRSSQQHFALLNQNGIGRGSTQCWAKRSSDRKRKMMGGPLGPAPTETPPLQPEGVNADEPMTQDGEGSVGRVSGRAGAGTGFGAVPPKPVSGKDVDEAYEKALRKLKGKGSNQPVSFEGIEAGPGVGENKKVMSRNIDIFDLIPENLQVTFERGLIAALSINLVVLISIGIGFAFQALPASTLELPDNIKSAALTVKTWVDTYDSAFNYSLLSFFLFSSLLGSFKIAQLGRGGTEYVEYNEEEDRASRRKR